MRGDEGRDMPRRRTRGQVGGTVSASSGWYPGLRRDLIGQISRATCEHCRPSGDATELAPAQHRLAAASNARVPALAWRCAPLSQPLGLLHSPSKPLVIVHRSTAAAMGRSVLLWALGACEMWWVMLPPSLRRSISSAASLPRGETIARPLWVGASDPPRSPRGGTGDWVRGQESGGGYVLEAG